MRAISTVLDATLCLVLVSASVLTLAGTPLVSESSSNGTADTADETAAVLSTSTARVVYRTESGNRTAHDTLAGLLATAALADANAPGTPAFVRAATERVTRALRSPTMGVQVVATVLPRNVSHGERDAVPDSYDGSADGRDTAPGSHVVAGTPPPSDVDVHAAAFAVQRVGLTVRTWSR